MDFHAVHENTINMMKTENYPGIYSQGMTKTNLYDIDYFYSF